MLESERFGSWAGAFTGAMRDKKAYSTRPIKELSFLTSLAMCPWSCVLTLEREPVKRSDQRVTYLVSLTSFTLTITVSILTA